MIYGKTPTLNAHQISFYPQQSRWMPDPKQGWTGKPSEPTPCLSLHFLPYTKCYYHIWNIHAEYKSIIRASWIVSTSKVGEKTIQINFKSHLKKHIF